MVGGIMLGEYGGGIWVGSFSGGVGVPGAL